MKIEEIENLWASQRPPANLGDPAVVRAQIHHVLKHRRWFLAFLAGTAVLGSVLGQVLFVVNTIHQGGPLSFLHWVSLVLSQVLNLAMLYLVYRSLQRNRELLRQHGETLRTVVGTGLANIEAEMAEYRGGGWIIVAGTASAMLAAYANFPYPHADGRSLLLRFGLIFALMGTVAFFIRRHYHQNLVPEHQRLQQALRDLHD